MYLQRSQIMLNLDKFIGRLSDFDHFLFSSDTIPDVRRKTYFILTSYYNLHFIRAVITIKRDNAG